MRQDVVSKGSRRQDWRIGRLPDHVSGSLTDVSVIVPTYCEAPNLRLLIPAINESLVNAGIHGEIIVVDDNSPDGTPAVCAEMNDFYPLRLIVRKEERGLSSAVLHGMRAARGEMLLVMDADLSHPPQAIPLLLNAMRDRSADFVVGSRYVAGGSTDENWGILRWFNSRIATWMARPLVRVCDPMAGFFVIRRSAFLAAERLNPLGYKIGLELLVKCPCRRVVEIPIHFHNRVHGKSKLSIRQQWQYLRHLFRLYRFKVRRAVPGLARVRSVPSVARNLTVGRRVAGSLRHRILRRVGSP